MSEAQDLEVLTSLAASGQAELAAQGLLARIAARQDDAGGHTDEARLAEQLGLSTAAVRAWQLAVRDDPGDLGAWEALALLHEERGEPERAEVCRTSVRRLGGTAPPGEPPPEPPPPGPSDADLVRFVYLFDGREDVHARMWRDERKGVGYSPVPGPLTPELARAHVEGRLTLGVYPVHHDDTVSFFALDLDLRREALAQAVGDAHRIRALRAAAAEEGLRLLAVLRGLGLDPLLEDSGQKGRHLWCFLAGPTPAAEVLALGRRLLAAHAPRNTMLHLEFFPKQASVAPGGTGNLIKLPLGLHLGSGRRSVILDDRGEPCADPWAVFRQLRRPPLTGLLALPEGAPPSEAPSLHREGAVPPVRSAPDRPWSEADFEAHPQVGAVLAGCAVLREAVRAALVERSLSREAAVVLEHTLGHLPAGVRATNYLFEQIPGFPASTRLGAPHRGQPTSCAKIRARLPEIAGRLSCACPFPERPGQYAHPLRHLEEAPAAAPPAPTLDELLAAYGRGLDHLRRLDEELSLLRRSAVAGLQAVPGQRWAAAGGEWRLEGDADLPELRWVADPAPAEA